jgi:hypothetical protein
MAPYYFIAKWLIRIPTTIHQDIRSSSRSSMIKALVFILWTTKLDSLPIHSVYMWLVSLHVRDRRWFFASPSNDFNWRLLNTSIKNSNWADDVRINYVPIIKLLHIVRYLSYENRKIDEFKRILVKKSLRQRHMKSGSSLSNRSPPP